MFRTVCIAFLLMFWLGSVESLAHDGHQRSVLDTCQAFAKAQNARDIAGVRASLSDRPDFLWVSDGKSYWGRETMLKRMATFQKADVWHGTTDLDDVTIAALLTTRDKSRMWLSAHQQWRL